MFSDCNVVFIGTTDFSVVILDQLIKDGYTVTAAVSQPDKPVGRRQVLTPTPVHQYCLDHGLLCVQPAKLRRESEKVLALRPDLVLTCAYGQIVPDDILQAPKYGCLNVHPSLLPKYRGGAPMQRAVWSGDDKTGVCLMQMVKAMDAGDVYACVEVPIGPDETTAELEKKLKEVSAELVHSQLPLYLEGKLKGIPQPESGVVLAPNISSEEELVLFQKEEAQAAYNHIRALIDWPMPYGLIDGHRIKFFKARLTLGDSGSAPGTLLDFAGGTMNIAAAGGVIHIYELQPEGRKPMAAKAFANGAGRALVGHRFA
jgi:methionyl-tRNA formyltransferase